MRLTITIEVTPEEDISIEDLVPAIARYFQQNGVELLDETEREVVGNVDITVVSIGVG